MAARPSQGREAFRQSGPDRLMRPMIGVRVSRRQLTTPVFFPKNVGLETLTLPMGANVLTQWTAPATEALRRVFLAGPAPTPAPTTGGNGNIGQIINGIAPDWG